MTSQLRKNKHFRSPTDASLFSDKIVNWAKKWPKAKSLTKEVLNGLVIPNPRLEFLMVMLKDIETIAHYVLSLHALVTSIECTSEFYLKPLVQSFHSFITHTTIYLIKSKRLQPAMPTSSLTPFLFHECDCNVSEY